MKIKEKKWRKKQNICGKILQENILSAVESDIY